MSISLSDFAKEMASAIGENDDRQSVQYWLDTGYAPLNEIISGSADRGVPYGRIIEIFGPPSCGKSVLATKLMIEAQKAGGVAIFMDHERTFDVSLAKSIGMSDQFPYWIYKRPKTWEESNNLAMKAAEVIRSKKAIPENAPIVVVFDSVAAMVPQSVFVKGIDEYNMNDTTALSRVASTTLKSINAFTADFNVTTIYLNQVRTKPGLSYGDPTCTPGGVAFEFFASIRMALSRAKVVEKQADGSKEFTGQLITIEAKKTKLTRPFRKVQVRLMFDEKGMAYFDITGSLLDYAVENDVLPTAGAWIVWSDGKKYQRKALIDKINSEGLQGELKATVHKAMTLKTTVAEESPT